MKIAIQAAAIVVAAFLIGMVLIAVLCLAMGWLDNSSFGFDAEAERHYYIRHPGDDQW